MLSLLSIFGDVLKVAIFTVIKRAILAAASQTAFIGIRLLKISREAGIDSSFFLKFSGKGTLFNSVELFKVCSIQNSFFF